jgi:hypothetical protein
VDLDEAAEMYRAAIEEGALEAYRRLADVLFDQAHDAFMADRERSHDKLRREAMKVLKAGARAGNYYCWLDLGTNFLKDKNSENATIAFRNFFRRRQEAVDAFELAVEPPPSCALLSYVPSCWKYLLACLQHEHRVDHLNELMRVRRSLLEHAEFMLRVGEERRNEAVTRQFASVLEWCTEFLFDPPTPTLSTLLGEHGATSTSPTKPKALPRPVTSNGNPVEQLGYRGLLPESIEDLTDDARLDD